MCVTASCVPDWVPSAVYVALILDPQTVAPCDVPLPISRSLRLRSHTTSQRMFCGLTSQYVYAARPSVISTRCSLWMVHQSPCTRSCAGSAPMSTAKPQGMPSFLSAVTVSVLTQSLQSHSVSRHTVFTRTQCPSTQSSVAVSVEVHILQSQ